MTQKITAEEFVEKLYEMQTVHWSIGTNTEKKQIEFKYACIMCFSPQHSSTC